MMINLVREFMHALIPIRHQTLRKDDPKQDTSWNLQEELSVGLHVHKKPLPFHPLKLGTWHYLTVAAK
jgi:hypothetical protein